MNNVNTHKIDRAEALTSVAHISLREEKTGRAARLFSPLFLAVLFVLMLVALVTGVNVYSRVAAAQRANNQSREGMELIINSIRANDATGSVAVGEGPEGRSLVVVQHLDSGTYEIRTYLYQGKILQEYAIQGAAYTPTAATELAESSTFSFGVSHGLFSITTDSGTCEVALRNLQGGDL